MKAQILTLLAGSSTEMICKNIAYIIEDFQEKHYVEKIDCPHEDFCAVFTSKKVSPNEAEILYVALDTVRQYERDRDYMEEEKIARLDTVSDDILNYIELNKIHKLPKLTKLLQELMFEPLYVKI